MKPRPLRIVVLGLSLSSSWGNGHATTYRALLSALARRGHDILFLERDVPWYADNRDLRDPSYCRLVLYRNLEELERHAREVAQADAVIVGSYVPQGIAVGDWALAAARGATAFYDIDTPVTLAAVDAGKCEYLAACQIADFDLYFSFTGGPVLDRLEARYGARAARALYCSFDPKLYCPLRVKRRWDLGYLGTYSADRQPTLERLLIQAARRRPDMRFVVAGPQYPDTRSWPTNVEHIPHLPPAEHPRFYSSIGWALNVTRADMIAAGFSPSVRLFEAAACGAPVISDAWAGLETIFQPQREILVAINASDVFKALDMPEQQRSRIGAAARRRALAEHTADHRAAQVEHELRAMLMHKRTDRQGNANRSKPEQFAGTYVPNAARTFPPSSH
jgi:spore maturation protein CgeB